MFSRLKTLQYIENYIKIKRKVKIYADTIKNNRELLFLKKKHVYNSKVACFHNF